jgi:hypothetical protein
MNTPHAISALIHDRLGRTLSDVFAANGTTGDIFSIRLEPGDTLLGQLEATDDGPPRVTLELVLDVIDSSLSTLPDVLERGVRAPGEFLRNARNLLRDRLVFFGQHTDDIATLVAAEDPASIRRAGDALFTRIDAACGRTDRSDVFQSMGQWLRLRPFIGGDIGTVLPLATLVSAVQGRLENAIRVPQSIELGLLDYFFKSSGFRTVDGASVVAPVHLSHLGNARSGRGSELSNDPAGLRPLTGFIAKATAEHYIRDITRVIVESAYDAGRGLRARFDDIAPRLRRRKPDQGAQAAIVEKFVAWFRGFSAMAESGTMRAVEVATQGVSQFQTNPLIAAASGSFAGTVARKLAQDSFLAVLRSELD